MKNAGESKNIIHPAHLAHSKNIFKIKINVEKATNDCTINISPKVFDGLLVAKKIKWPIIPRLTNPPL